MLAGQLFLFVHRHAVNLLYWDQWDFYAPLFDSLGLWDTFRWQHGPHRQGVGMFLIKILADFTDWNSRADAFAVSAALCVAMSLALYLKHRIYGYFTLTDAAILCIYTSLFSYEALVLVPNVSHGALPTLMILVYCLMLLVSSSICRYLGIVITNFLLLYTGFGIFMTPITVGLLLIDGMQNRADTFRVILVTVALFLTLLSIASFLVGYQFNPAIPDWQFRLADVQRLPLFISLMLASFWGWHASILGESVPIVLGSFLLGALVGVLAFHAYRLWRDGVFKHKLSIASVVLIGFTLLFCLNTAVGRIPLGLQAAQSSRYLPLMLPAYLALYLNLLALPQPALRRVMLAAYLCCSIPGVLPLGAIDNLARPYALAKTQWKECYLRSRNVDLCNSVSSLQIHPKSALVSERLNYLQQRDLNLFTGM